MQNFTEQLSQNSSSSDDRLIKSLKSLRAITLDSQWKEQEKARIFAMASQAIEERERISAFSLAHAMNWVFRPLPSGAFAMTMSMLTGGFAIMVFVSGGFQPAVSTQIDIARISHNATGNVINVIQEVAPDNQGASEPRTATALNKAKKYVASANGANVNTSSSNTQTQVRKSDSPAFSQSLSSLELYGDDTATAFRTFLRERLNRVWVEAQENGNESVIYIAKEAEKFYAEGDYDAVLRAVSAAEALLK
ncbi:MAG: hypothetical protein HYV65_02325 [Candidatus Spechtbacteria bacterium]|nr:hypothetical protein [Candidatus Spechtbacteria bacterium]